MGEIIEEGRAVNIYLPFFLLINLWGEIYPNGQSVCLPPMQMLQQFWVQLPSTAESEGR